MPFSIFILSDVPFYLSIICLLSVYYLNQGGYTIKSVYENNKKASKSVINNYNISNVPRHLIFMLNDLSFIPLCCSHMKISMMKIPLNKHQTKI